MSPIPESAQILDPYSFPPLGPVVLNNKQLI